MDLNGKAGERLAKIFLAIIIVFGLYAAMRKPAYYHAFAYYQLDSTWVFPNHGVRIGDEIISSDEALTKLFGNKKYRLGEPEHSEYEEDWAGIAHGNYTFEDFSFDAMTAAAIGDTLRQVSYSQGFRGIMSVYRSNQFFKHLHKTIKRKHGNGLNTYQAWSNKGAPTQHSFDILIERERIGFGFYHVKILFSQPDYKETDLYFGKRYYDDF